MTVFSTTVAIFFAFMATRTDAPLRGEIVSIMTLTYLVPTIFLAFAWTMLGNPRAGLINVFLMDGSQAWGRAERLLLAGPDPGHGAK